MTHISHWTLLTISIVLVIPFMKVASAEYFDSQKDSLAILFPEDSGYTQWTKLSVVVQFNYIPGDSVIFLANEESIVPDTLVSCGTQKYVAHLSIDLRPGANIVRAIRLRGNSAVDEVVTNVVFWHELLTGGLKPEGLTAVTFHSPLSESFCGDCHSFPEQVKSVDPALANTSCMSCHSGLLAKGKKHGPSQAGDCIECHSQTGTGSRFAMVEPVKELCFSCHDDNTGGKTVHGPTSTGRCTICHEPHSTDNAYFLRKPVWELCTTCHAEKASGAHVVAGFVFGTSHPTKGWPDPTQPGKDFSCASCHNPHSADNPRLWKYGVTRRGQLCVVCHKK